ncbi:MAG: transcriptional regulator [Thermoproteota archaeon]
MNNDQILGALILVGSIVGIVVYAVLLYYIPMWTLQVSAFLAMTFVLGIMAWIGYTLATTPPPKPIEEVEKEIEAETKTESEAKEEKKP